mmetsp:Transcript_16092/g.23842  ORF Transcript_16092/g.23842 Transcript_16092/m.23842 type:complete len:936 (-) Transcript_16092:26-2833(-)
MKMEETDKSSDCLLSSPFSFLSHSDLSSETRPMVSTTSTNTRMGVLRFLSSSSSPLSRPLQQQSSSIQCRNVLTSPPYLDVDDGNNGVSTPSSSVVRTIRMSKTLNMMSPPPPTVAEEGKEHEEEEEKQIESRISSSSPFPPPPPLSSSADQSFTPLRSRFSSCASACTPHQPSPRQPNQLNTTPQLQKNLSSSRFSENVCMPSLLRQLSIGELDRQQRIRREEKEQKDALLMAQHQQRVQSTREIGLFLELEDAENGDITTPSSFSTILVPFTTAKVAPKTDPYITPSSVKKPNTKLSHIDIPIPAPLFSMDADANFTTPQNRRVLKNKTQGQRLQIRPKHQRLSHQERTMQRMKNYCPRCGGKFRFRCLQASPLRGQKICHCGREAFIKQEEEEVGQVLMHRADSIGHGFFPSPVSDRFVLQFPCGDNDEDAEEEKDDSHVTSFEDDSSIGENSEDVGDQEVALPSSSLYQCLQTAINEHSTQSHYLRRDGSNSVSSSSSSTSSCSSTSTTPSSTSSPPILSHKYNRERPFHSLQRRKKQKILLKPKHAVQPPPPPPPPLFSSAATPSSNSSTSSLPPSSFNSNHATIMDTATVALCDSIPPPFPLSPTTMFIASSTHKNNTLRHPIPRFASSSKDNTSNNEIAVVRAAPRDVRKSLLEPPASVGSIVEEFRSHRKEQELKCKEERHAGIPGFPLSPPHYSNNMEGEDSKFAAKNLGTPVPPRFPLSSSAASNATNSTNTADKKVGGDDGTHSAEQVAMAVKAAARFGGGEFDLCNATASGGIIDSYSSGHNHRKHTQYVQKQHERHLCTLEENTKYQSLQNDITPTGPQKSIDSNGSFLFMPLLGSSLTLDNNNSCSMPQSSCKNMIKDELSSSAHEARLAASDFFRSLNVENGLNSFRSASQNKKGQQSQRDPDKTEKENVGTASSSLLRL